MSSNNDSADVKPQDGAQKQSQNPINEKQASAISLTLNNGQVKQRKVVGFFRQVVILFWKNSILFRRNVAGTVAEVLVALLFVLMLALMRFISDVPRYSDQTNSYDSNPIKSVVQFINISTTSVPVIYYYPNNAYVLSLVTAAYNIIRAQQGQFTATRNR